MESGGLIFHRLIRAMLRTSHGEGTGRFSGLGAGLFLFAGLALSTLPLQAQYVAPYVAVQGALSSSNGMPAQNYILSFQPTQLFFVGGTSVVVDGSTCGTDVTGQVVGVRNPLTQAPVAVQYSGTLSAGNYFVYVTWYDTYAHQTLPSPVVTAQLTSAGSLIVSPPSGGAPANAIGMDVYIGTSSTSLTYQGQTTATWATFTQSTPLSAGAAPPTTNTTVCQVVANDAGWPTGTGYNVSLTTASGNTVPGYPMQWQFLGPGSAYNLSNGIPYYNGRVTYPVPVLTSPLNHNLQSINGPLSMGTPGGVGYNIVNVNELGVGTSLPAWGVDVEGTGLAGAVNANTGYLYNGLAPSNHVLLGNGSYYVDSASIPSTIISGLPSSFYYQTIQLNGTAQPQEPAANFSPRFAMTDNTGVATNVDLATQSGITAGTYSCTTFTVNAYGILTSASTGVCSGTTLLLKITSGICTTSGAETYCASPMGPYTWPSGGFADTNYAVTCSYVGQPTGTGTNPGLYGPYVVSKTATQISLQMQSGSASAAGNNTVAEIDCIGRHT